jgi:dihydropteroate synthase
VKDIIIDPGFGFAKTIEQNFELLENLELLNLFELPILVGLSRKSMIWKSLKGTAEDALNGTSILNTKAVLKGARILRVHDVLEASELKKLLIKNVL